MRRSKEEQEGTRVKGGTRRTRRNEEEQGGTRRN